MRTLALLILAACGGSPADPTPAPSQPEGPQGPPSQGLGTGLSPAEDLSSSRRDELKDPVPTPTAADPCPDGDGDGFVSALACPGADPTTLDCDDGDPAITPATERWVRPGPFLMGSQSAHAGRDEQPVHVVRLSGYCLDTTEVRAADFGAWLQGAGRQAEGPDLRSLSKDGVVEAGREDHPAEGVTWEEAQAYCVAQGKALPTEAQWEKAARGGCEAGTDPASCDRADLRPYPWGTAAPTCLLANHQLSTQGFPKLCKSDTVPVTEGAAGAGPYGHRLLAGNAWEYVADTWQPDTYGDGSPRIDPAGPSQGTIHVLRGGGWNTFSTNMRAANRFHDLVMGSASGFRCARPTVAPTPDDVAPMLLVQLSGTLTRASGVLSGRALYVSAFDATDADPQTGMLTPGRSPVAEVRLQPNGQASQPFTLQVPWNGTYLVSAALDNGSGAQKDDYVSASGSGGFGNADQNPIEASGAKDGLTITLLVPHGRPARAPGNPPSRR